MEADDSSRTLHLPVRYVGRTTVHVRLPETEGGAGGAPAVLAVHGYAQPPLEMLRFATSVAPPDAVVIVPEAPSSFYLAPRRGSASAGGFGHGWVAEPDRDAADLRNDRLLLRALRAAAAARPIDPARTVALGYSQGAGVATHFATAHPSLVRLLVGVAGGVPAASRSRLATWRDREVLWVSGTHDRAYPPEYVATLLEAVRSSGARSSAVALDAGHGLLDDARDVVRRWLAERLPGAGGADLGPARGLR